MKKIRVIAIAATACALGVAGTAMVGASNGNGSERELSVKAPVTAYSAIPAPNPVTGVNARVSAETGDGQTEASLTLRGFDRAYAGRTFGAHFHTGPCVDGVTAGPHYQDSAVTTIPLEQREVWLDFTVTAGGNAKSRAERHFELRPGGAKSIVIHANPTTPDGMAGARLGCISLEL
jgi:Cu-Zn family superoxide dismutase